MAYRNILLGQSPDELAKQKDFAETTTPDSSIGYVLGEAIDSPTYFGAGIRMIQDKIQGEKELSPYQLQKLYPDAPAGTFTTPNTVRMADYIMKRLESNKSLDFMSEFRNQESPVMQQAARFGYGMVQEANPINIGVGILSAGAVATYGAAAGLGTVALETGAFTANMWGRLAISTATALGDWGARKALEKKTQEEATYTDLAASAILGFGIGEVTHFGMNKAKAWLNRSSPEVKAAMQSAAEDLFREHELGKVPNNMGDAFNPDGLSTLDRLKFKVYSASEGGEKTGKLYALYNKESPMTHNSPEMNFGNSTYLTDNKMNPKAFSAAVNQGGHIVEIDPSNFNIADLSRKEVMSTFESVLKGHADIIDGEIPKDLSPQEMIKFINKQEVAPILEHDIVNELKNKGYDSLTYPTSDTYNGKTYDNNHFFAFDGIHEKPMKVTDIVDGSLGSLPEYTVMNNKIASKNYNIKYTDEGILSNGKKIRLDPEGYFHSDIVADTDQAKLNYVEYFSKDQIDAINQAVDSSRPNSILKKYEGITKETLDFVRQLKSLSEIETMANEQAKAENAVKFPAAFDVFPEAERQQFLKTLEPNSKTRGILDDLMKQLAKDAGEEADKIHMVQQLQNDFIERLKADEVTHLVNKTVEQLAKEGKAMSILEKAGLEEETKTMVDRVFNRVGTKQEGQIGPIIENYEARIKEIQKENPEIAKEIATFMDDCLRGFTR